MASRPAASIGENRVARPVRSRTVCWARRDLDGGVQAARTVARKPSPHLTTWGSHTWLTTFTSAGASLVFRPKISLASRARDGPICRTEDGLATRNDPDLGGSGSSRGSLLPLSPSVGARILTTSMPRCAHSACCPRARRCCRMLVSLLAQFRRLTGRWRRGGNDVR